MKKLKLVCVFGWVVGALLMVLPFLLALARILWGDTPVGIIGGADCPTFRLALDQYIWLTWLGISTILSFLILFFRHKGYMEKR